MRNLLKHGLCLFAVCVLATVVFILSSCKKEFSGKNAQTLKAVNAAKVFRVPSTPKEKLLVSNLSKLTSVFKKLYKERSNIKLVNAAILSKAYTDQSILVKDLIYPDVSRLNAFSRFSNMSAKWGVSLTSFSDAFWKEVNKTNDIEFKTFLQELKSYNNSRSVNARIEGDYGDGVGIYMPYADLLFDPNSSDGSYYTGSITSLVTATADADEGWGNEPVYDANNNLVGYTQVLVNDDYAFNNPTQIIGINGIEPLSPNRVDSVSPPPPPPPGVNRVYIGEGICKVQYDRLISFTGNGGGSEIKYVRLTGYLQPVNGQVTTFQDIISVDFSRSDIRIKTWRRVFGIWDNDWVIADAEQILGIYEEDNTNTRTFNGSLSTRLDSLGIPVQATIGFNVTIQSQDDIIRQLKISRNSYFAGAFIDQGQGFTDDRTFIPASSSNRWPAYEVHYQLKTGANVGWTWPYNSF